MAVASIVAAASCAALAASAASASSRDRWFAPDSVEARSDEVGAGSATQPVARVPHRPSKWRRAVRRYCTWAELCAVGVSGGGPYVFKLRRSASAASSDPGPGFMHQRPATVWQVAACQRCVLWWGFRAECMGWRGVNSWVDGWLKGGETRLVGFGWSGLHFESPTPIRSS